MTQKEFDPEDPMELVGVEAPGGDADEAINGIALEYLLLGWSQARILSLFRNPLYKVTHQLYLLKGHEYVKQRISALVQQWNNGWLNGGEANAQGV